MSKSIYFTDEQLEIIFDCVDVSSSNLEQGYSLPEGCKEENMEIIMGKISAQQRKRKSEKELKNAKKFFWC